MWSAFINKVRQASEGIETWREEYDTTLTQLMQTHRLRRPVLAGRAQQKRRNLLAVGIALAVVVVVIFSLLLMG